MSLNSNGLSTALHGESQTQILDWAQILNWQIVDRLMDTPFPWYLPSHEELQWKFRRDEWLYTVVL